MLRSATKNQQRFVAGGLACGTGAVALGINRRSSHVFLEEAKQFSTTKYTPPVLPSRSEQLERLSSVKEYDVLVIGGGATGCGAALDAQMRGLNTALIERGDFSSETSGRSTKLIWAGIRYIATATGQLLRFKNITRPINALSDFSSELKMVVGAHKERRILLENNPHLTNWVPIAVPMKTWTVWPAPLGHPIFSLVPMVLPAVFKFYDSLSGFSCPPSHIMSRSRAQRKFPQLDEDFKYVSVFYEGQHNDSRTATCIALTAAEEGAAIANYTEMVETICDDSGKAVGIVAQDKISGEKIKIFAKSIIFCGGPFTDELRKVEDPNCKPAVRGAAGTHIVLPGYYTPDGFGLLDVNTSDGRFLFFLPWEGATLVGTTDRKGPVTSSPGPPEEEIQFLLHESEKYLSKDLCVRRSDVLSAWQGFRPLASDPHAPPDAPISRDHVISTNPDTGITFITGGKWTTYREMAEDVIDRVIKEKNLSAGPCRTVGRPLRGGVGYSKNISIQLMQQFGTSEASSKHLAKTYGVNAFDVCKLAKPTGKTWPRFGHLLIEGFPYLECEVEWVCKNEMAVTVKDMLTIRTRLAFLNSDAAKTAAPKVADLMSKFFGWSKAEKKQQLDEAEKYLAEFGGRIPQNEATQLSTMTQTDIHSLFETFDRDHNGYIDFAEMIQMSKHLGYNLTEAQAKKSFERMDLDHNGRITEEHFAQWWNTTGPDDELRKELGQQMKSSADKLGKGSESRGTVFG